MKWFPHFIQHPCIYRIMKIVSTEYFNAYRHPNERQSVRHTPTISEIIISYGHNNSTNQSSPPCRPNLDTHLRFHTTTPCICKYCQPTAVLTDSWSLDLNVIRTVKAAQTPRSIKQYYCFSRKLKRSVQSGYCECCSGGNPERTPTNRLRS